MTIACPSPDNDYQSAHALLILETYRRWFNEDLIAPCATAAETARRLFEADFAVLSHDDAPDPRFNYANRAGLALFEMDWAQLLATPSRASAEPIKQEEREQLLAKVSRQGYIDNYHGVRISRTGKRFSIANARVWNLLDPADQRYLGQAALLRAWQYLPGDGGPNNI
ncbi:MAG: MEKHLA domain-containing protein [Methylococcaceae bacterium]|nr:MAG: MEKHLA domain-containing protein [Methylococcaceae bacterium]